MPIFTAIRWNRIKLTFDLIEQGFNLEQRNINGHTPLILASHFGRTEIIEILIKKGCNIDTLDIQYEIPAFNYVLRQKIFNLKNLELLIKNYCLINIKDYIGNTVYDIMDKKYLQILNKLILDTGLIGVCIRYVKTNINKFNKQNLLILPKDIKKHLRYYIN